jgi:amino acid transporter
LQGFANAALLAIWAAGDQVFIGVMGGEAESPRYSMAHSANLVPWRVGVFYLVSVVLVSLIVPSDDSRLLGSSSSAASPFVIAVQNAGIKGVPDLINACMIIGITAIALESIFLPSRILRTMALQELIPSFLAKTDEKGRPRWALSITATVAIILTYMSLSGKYRHPSTFLSIPLLTENEYIAGGLEVLNWLISITSTSFFINWAIIAFTSFRFRAAAKAQKASIFNGPYGWKSPYWPLAPTTVLVISAFLLVCVLYLSIDGVVCNHSSLASNRALTAVSIQTQTGFTVYSFFSYNIGLVLILVSMILYKIILRTPWRDPAIADLVTGHRILTAHEIQELDAYYQRPMWRRVGTYLRMW